MRYSVIISLVALLCVGFGLSFLTPAHPVGVSVLAAQGNPGSDVGGISRSRTNRLCQILRLLPRHPRSW